MTVPFLIQSGEKLAGSREAVRRIEDWLLHSGIQIDEGAERGGVAGWLDENGMPDYVYLEIAGYYLTAMAWISSGVASSPQHAADAKRSARDAADWVASMVGRGYLPTRLYLSRHAFDWRNGGVFSFDVAMAARGLGAVGHIFTAEEHRKALGSLSAILHDISLGAEVMVSHKTVTGHSTKMPDRWSTRPGPHHLKAAAAVLRLPGGTASTALGGVANRTFDHWTACMEADQWPCQEVHPLLYGLEGLLIRAGSTDRDALGVVEELFIRLMESQAADGTLTETVDGGIVRSDVLAQALRVGLLLRSRHYLAGAGWTGRLDRLAGALLEFVQPDGGVRFAKSQSISNTWCAMFAHQALYLYSRRNSHDPVPPSTFDFLV